MDLNKLYYRYQEVIKLYEQSDLRRIGKPWPREEYIRGFVGDVGALVKLTMGKDGLRDIKDVDQKLAHELSDCLYSIFIIAEKYGINLEKSFMDTMDELEKRAQNNELATSHSL
jgi:NTP pyrophosphatase (non-canonical NTP hydrolase)